MSWPEALAAEITDALASGQPREIVVPNATRAELGRLAAERLVRTVGGDADLLTFKVEAP
jgi:hypothetical protein